MRNHFRKKIYVLLSEKEFWIANLGQAANILSLFLQTKLIVMYFSRAEYGNWSILMTYYTMLQMLPFTAVNNAICRYSAEYRNHKNVYLSAIITGYLFIFLIQTVVFEILCLAGIVDYNFENYQALFMVYCFLETIKGAFFHVYTYLRKRNRVLLCYIVDFILTGTGLGSMYLMQFMTIKYILAILCLKDFLLIILINREFHFQIQKDMYVVIYTQLFKFSVPVIIWNIFGYIQGVINKWLLNYYLSAGAVAMYTVAVGVAMYIPVFYQSFISNYFYPVLYGQKEEMTVKKYLKYVLIFALPLIGYCILMPFLGRYIIIMAYDKKYLDVRKYTGIACVSCAAGILADLGLFEILKLGLTRKLVIPKICPGIVMTVMGFILVSEYGLTGAIANYCLGQWIYAVLAGVVCIHTQIKIQKERVEKQ